MLNEIKVRQICLFFIAFLPLSKIFSLPSIIADASNEDMWISTLFNVLIEFLTLSVLLRISKSTDKTIYELLEDKFGKTVTKIIMGIYFAYFILKCIIPISEQRDYIEITLYETPPNILTFLPFFLVSAYFCMKKIRILGRSADIMWIFTLLGIITLCILSISATDFGAILPIGARGLSNILKGSYYSLSRFGDAIYFMFMLGRFKKTKNFTLKIAGSFFISELFVIYFMIIFYCIFTSISGRQIFALTEISKYSTVINNVGRIDYLAIIFILFSNVFSLSLPIYFSVDILRYIFGTDKSLIYSIVINSCLVLFFIIFEEYFSSIEDFILNYLSAFFLIFSNVLPMLFVLLLKGENKYELKTD